MFQVDPPQPPNIVVIIVDDMRADELQYMPSLWSDVVPTAFVFENAFVSTPLCCPDRAAILSGGYYAKDHGVLTNDRPNGSVFAFDDSDTLATRLQAAGYNTGLVGKYLNKYETWAFLHSGEEIPPGWNSFHGWETLHDWASPFPLMVGASGPYQREPGTIQQFAGYQADTLGALARMFASGPEPFFLFYAPFSIHLPTIPDPQDSGASWSPFRPSAWGEDVSDKPPHVAELAADWWGGDPNYYAASQPWRPGHVTPDDFVIHRRQCLLSLDRNVAALRGDIANSPLADRTVFFLTSDNGYLLGEHRLYGKALPYEESIRVPLLVWGAGIAPGTSFEFVNADIDLARTVVDLSGAAPFASSPGLSLLAAAAGHAGRPFVFVQGWVDDDDDRTPGFAGIRAHAVAYFEYDSGDVEYFDMVEDPHQLTSVVAEHVEECAALSGDLGAMRGLSMRTMLLPDGAKNEPYSYQLDAWGGTPPYAWSLAAGQLPGGLSLSPGGILAGVPTNRRAFSFRVRVADQSSSPVHGGPQQFLRDFDVVIR